MGRQKQLIVPPEDSVVESMRTGDQVQPPQHAWVLSGHECMIVETPDSEHRTRTFACPGMAKGNAEKGIMAV